MINVFIDESGTLPDPKDKFVVICGVSVRQIKEAENIFSRILISLKTSKTKLREIKFYYAGEKTKRRFLSGLVSANFDIFVLAVNKKGRKIIDSPENYGILIADIINEMGLWYKSKEMSFVLDRHFYRKVDQDEFDDILKKEIENKLSYKIDHVDSRENYLVNIADMAAGAVLNKYNKNNAEFYNIIKDNIIIEKIINWQEIKRKSLRQKKIT